MIRTSHCKINIGLQILSKRSDGFHELSTIMYPIVQVGDLVELRAGSSNEFFSSGIIVDCPSDKNLCMKALRLMQERYGIPPSGVWLHKQIPFGAGLGGGSANAVAVLKLANDEFGLGLSDIILCDLAAELGSDTPFFVDQKPALATSRGEVLSPIDIDLGQYYIYIVKPDIAISTALAYSGVTPKQSEIELTEAVKLPVQNWKEMVKNDFEDHLFVKFPKLKQIKEELYQKGALFASLSGSGSAIYGIFDKPVEQKIEDLWHVEKPRK